ncbi:MAG TPA: hypothetical protein EYP61_02215 [Candidatus Latescibacteria bacterium]|nr:hypothetical protein [Candidatus Latescibacterota bacterium]
MLVGRPWKVALVVGAAVGCYLSVRALQDVTLRYLQGLASSKLGRRVSVGSLRVGLGTWYLSDVRISDQVQIPLLRLKYRLLPWKVTEISLYGPILNLKGGPPLLPLHPPPVPLNFRRGRLLPWAEDLSGRIYAGGDTVRLEVEGSLGGGVFSLKGYLEEKFGTGRMELVARGVDLGSLPKEISSWALSGLLSLRAELSLEDFSPSRATFRMRGEDVTLKGLSPLSQVWLEGERDERCLWIRRLRGVSEGRYFEGEGKMTDEGLDLDILIPQFELASATDGFLNGKGNIRLDIKGTWEGIKISGRGEVPIAFLERVRIEDLSFSFQQEPGLFRLSRASGYIGGGRVEGWGRFPRNGPSRSRWRIEGVEGESLWGFLLPKVRLPKGKIWGTLYYDGDEWRFLLDRAELVWRGRALPALRGVLRGGGGQVRFRISGPGLEAAGQAAKQGFKVSLRVERSPRLAGRDLPLTCELTASRTGDGPIVGHLHVKGPFWEAAGPYELLPEGEGLVLLLRRGFVYVSGRAIPYRGVVRVDPGRTRWDLEVAGGKLSGRTEDGEILASLDDFSLAWLGLEGNLSGSVRAYEGSGGGTLVLSNLGLKGRGGMDGSFRFGWDGEGPWLEGTVQDRWGILGEVSYRGGEFRAAGLDIEISRIARLLTPQVRLRGMFSYDMEVSARGYRAHVEAVGVRFREVGIGYVGGEVRGKLNGNALFRLKLSGERVKGKAEGDLRDGTLDLKVSLEGDLLSSLLVLGGGAKASGYGKLELAFKGSYDSPKLKGFNLSLEDGKISWGPMEVQNIVVEAHMEPDGFLKVEKFRAKLDGGRLEVSNRRGERSLKLGDVNLGVLQLNTGPSGIELHIPGVMSPGGTGTFVFYGKRPDEPFLIEGPPSSPRMVGTVLLRNAEITYPPTGGRKMPSVWDRTDWDITLVAGEEVWYFRDAIFGAGARLRIEEGDRLTLHGCPARGDFWMEGNLRATSGTIFYLDREFEVEEAGIEFNTKYGVEPVVYGSAETKVRDENTGKEFPVYLRLYAWNPKTGTKLERAPLSECFLDVDVPPSQDISKEEVLKLLGYPLEEYPRKVAEALGIGIEDKVFRSILSPIEYRLRRAIGLDVLQIQPSLMKNLLSPSGPSLTSLLYGTKLTLGERIGTRGLLFYRGELEPPKPPYGELWSVQHLLGLEYRLWTDTWLKLEYSYDPLSGERDRRVGLKHRIWW